MKVFLALFLILTFTFHTHAGSKEDNAKAVQAKAKCFKLHLLVISEERSNHYRRQNALFQEQLQLQEKLEHAANKAEILYQIDVNLHSLDLLQRNQVRYDEIHQERLQQCLDRAENSLNN